MFLQDRSPLRSICVCLAFLFLSTTSGCGRKGDAITNRFSDARAVTFNRDVAPIVFEKCATCHHPGEAAPFSLTTYEQVRRRATQIVEVTQRRIMPPWLPTPEHGDFVGARRLTDQELQILERWAKSGSPLGDEADAPSTPEFAEGWQTGLPDLILESPAFHLPSQSSDVFRNFVVPIHLAEARWIRSVELRPVNPRATHHARLGVDSSGESIRRDAEDAEPGYAGMSWGQDPEGQLVIWAPGMVAKPGLPGVAWRLYPNTCLVLHTHMQPTGKAEEVKFRIGIHFADEPPTISPAILRIGSCEIDIPAHAPRHVVKGEYVLPIDVDLHTVFPHAHSLCKELHLEAERPDGTREPLLSIEHFDENWHESYDYRHPVRLPRGTRLRTTFTYDNTDGNLRNRNHPPRRVVYGSNVTDEMADVYVQVTAVRPDQRAVLMENYKRHELEAQLAGVAKSLEVYPDDPWRLEEASACWMGLGKPNEAIKVLEQRLKTGPVAVFPVAGLGMAFLAQGDFDQAEKRQRQAIAMDSEYPLAWLGLGKVLAYQKKPEPAEAAFRKALKLAPSLIDAALGLSDLLVQQGKLEEAASVCHAAINDSPESANLYLKLAEICAKERHYDECLRFCSSAQRLAPYTHPPKVLLAVYCFQNGNPEKARTLLREASADAPDYPMPPLMLGQLARGERRLEDARRYYAIAAEQPIPLNWPESHKQRFLVLLQSERLQLAQQLDDIVLARDALSEWLKCEPSNLKLQGMYEELSHARP